MTDIVFYGHMTCQCLAGIQSVLVLSFRRLKLHRGSKADQYKKKIAKLETDLRVLQEGGPLEARYLSAFKDCLKSYRARRTNGHLACKFVAN